MHDVEYTKAALKEAVRLARVIMDSLDGITNIDEDEVNSEDWRDMIRGMSTTSRNLLSLFNSLL